MACENNREEAIATLSVSCSEGAPRAHIFVLAGHDRDFFRGRSLEVNQLGCGWQRLEQGRAAGFFLLKALDLRAHAWAAYQLPDKVIMGAQACYGKIPCAFSSPDKLGNWLAVTGVAIGFIVLGWLLFSENPSDKNKRKP